MTPIPPLSLSNEALLTFESVWWWGNGGPFLLNNVTEKYQYLYNDYRKMTFK